MKKLLTALILSTLVLSGCGLFGKNHAWKEAKQENPLQIPPGLDRPSTSAALTIPPPSNTQPTATTQQPPTVAGASAASASPTQLHLAEDVDAAYERVGLVLQQGGLGAVTAQDAAQHTYELSIDTGPELGSSESFLQKHFSNLNQPQDGTQSGSSGSAQAADQSTTTVMLTVSPAKGGNGSTVRAQGNPKQAVHVISVLRGRLGG
ncbi:MAG TPA: hypothetical protein VFJ15_14130 [Oleiagrimonas sp.]|nr:hypothetical protein [Oleiagrimonas sp.]